MLKKSHVLLLALCCAVCLTAGILSPGGKSYTEIVIAPDAPGYIKLATKELSDYLGKTCGAALAVSTEYHNEAPAIFVGASAYTESHGITTEGLKSEGYKIISTDQHLVILGRDYDGHPITIPERHPWRPSEIYCSELDLGLYGEQGSMNGVYAFLKKYAGCRWYAPGELGEVIQPVETLNIPAFEESDAPVFSQRYTYYALSGARPQEMLYLRRNGQGGLSPHYSMHSFYLMDIYQESHPEFFALVDGQRDFGGLCCLSGESNLCLSAPGLVEAYADYARKFLDSHPGLKSFPVFPGDGMTRICECPDCQAQIDYEAPYSGKLSNYVWGFVCKVAEEVKKTHPDCIMACAGYDSFRIPPSKIKTFPDNVGMQLVYDRDYEMLPAHRAFIRETLDAWKTRTHHIFSWAHYLFDRAAWKGLPIGSPTNLQNDFAYLQSLGVWDGEMIEANGEVDVFSLNHPGLTHWKIYLSMKAHWNPNFDFNAEMEEYYKLYYGPASDPMRDFWTSAFASNDKAGAACEGMALIPEAVYTIDLLEKMNACLLTAKSLVPADSLYARRIAQVDEEFQVGRRNMAGLLQDGSQAIEVPAIADIQELEQLPLQRFVSRYGAPKTPNTWVRAARDAKNLYLQFICYELPERGILATAQPSARGASGNDPAVWSDDFMEMYFCNDPANPAYAIQFAINPAGAVWDARYGIGLFSKEWNSTSVQVKTSVEDSRWLLTMSLSLEELGYQNFKAGDEIRANFYRGRHEEGNPNNIEYSCWSPVFCPENYCPNRFGKLVWK